MGITEVIRGDDLLDTTGQQLYLYNTLQQCYPHKHIEVPIMVMHPFSRCRWK